MLLAMDDGQENMAEHLRADEDRPRAGSSISNTCEDGAPGLPEQLSRSKRERRPHPKYIVSDVAAPIKRYVSTVSRRDQRDVSTVLRREQIDVSTVSRREQTDVSTVSRREQRDVSTVSQMEQRDASTASKWGERNPVLLRIASIKDQLKRDGLAGGAFIQVACRICLQDNGDELDSPCACSGSQVPTGIVSNIG